MTARCCPHCDAPADDSARFCAQCGSILPQVATASTTHTTSPPTSPLPDTPFQSERRQITVMFSDLVGSTQISTQLDPEDFAQLLITYRSACSEIIEHWGGYLANFLGDGVLAYFGWPEPHEDDPQRAVYAALDIIQKIQTIHQDTSFPQQPLATRIGIGTGLVLIGSIGEGQHRETSGIVGEVPNIAAKIQTAAAVNTVFVNALTRKILLNKFNFQSAGTLTVRGLDKTVHAYQVISEKSDSLYYDTERYQHQPLCGRAQPFAQLKHYWQQAGTGQLQTAILQGEPGIGKSRLIWALREWLLDQPHSLVVFNCSAYHTQSAYYPVFDFFDFELEHNSSDRMKSRIRLLLQQLNNDATQTNKPSQISATATALKLDHTHKQLIFDWVEHALMILSRRLPLLAIIEDMHWMDPSSHELFRYLAERLAKHRILVVITSRRHESFDIGNTHTMPLTPLSERASQKLIQQTAKDIRLTPRAVATLCEASDGNPLFIEELTHDYLENLSLTPQTSNKPAHSESIDTAAELDIPASLQDLLRARMQKTDQENRVIYLAAAIGRQFDIQTLQTIAELTPAALTHTLNQLEQAELIHRSATYPDTHYEFRHALIREAAYNTLLIGEREAIHQRIAQALLQHHPGIREQSPELMAYHLSEAGNFEDAVTAWAAAGQKALRLSADTEAANHFQRALRLLDQLPNTPENQAIQLQLLIQSGAPMIATRSWSASSVKRIYQRAAKLSQGLAEPMHLFTSLRGLWGNAMLRGELKKAQQYVLKLTLISQGKDPLSDPIQQHALNIESTLAAAMTGYWRGTYELSLSQLEHVNQLYQLHSFKEHAYTFAIDPYTASLFYAARIEWVLGNTPAAVKHIDESIKHAEALRHYPSLSWGLGFHANILYEQQHYTDALQKAERAIDLSSAKLMPLWNAWGQVMAGSAKAAMGRSSSGIQQIQDGIQLYNQCEARIALPVFYHQLAEASLRDQQLPLAQSATNTGIAIAKKCGIHSAQPQLWERHAECLHHKSPDPAADSPALMALQKAYQLAQQQGALNIQVQILAKQYQLFADTPQQETASILLRPLAAQFEQKHYPLPDSDAGRLAHSLSQT